MKHVLPHVEAMCHAHKMKQVLEMVIFHKCWLIQKPMKFSQLPFAVQELQNAVIQECVETREDLVR